MLSHILTQPVRKKKMMATMPVTQPVRRKKENNEDGRKEIRDRRNWQQREPLWYFIKKKGVQQLEICSNSNQSFLTRKTLCNFVKDAKNLSKVCELVCLKV